MAFSGFTQLVATRLPILRFAMVKTSSTYHQKSPSHATQPHLFRILAGVLSPARCLRLSIFPGFHIQTPLVPAGV